MRNTVSQGKLTAIILAPSTKLDLQCSSVSGMTWVVYAVNTIFTVQTVNNQSIPNLVSLELMHKHMSMVVTISSSRH